MTFLGLSNGVLSASWPALRHCAEYFDWTDGAKPRNVKVGIMASEPRLESRTPSRNLMMKQG